MGIKLPETRFSAAPQSKKREVPTKEIIDIEGNNPIAEAIKTITPALSEAIERRRALRKQGELIASMAKAGGEEVPANPENYDASSYEKLLTLKNAKTA